MQLIVTSLLLVLHMCPPLVVKPPVKKAKLFGLLNFLIAIFFGTKSHLFRWQFRETFGQDCHIFCNFKLIANKKTYH